MGRRVLFVFEAGLASKFVPRESLPFGQHQRLEELFTPPDGDWEKAQYDLYMPIAG